MIAVVKPQIAIAFMMGGLAVRAGFCARELRLLRRAPDDENALSNSRLILYRKEKESGLRDCSHEYDFASGAQ